MSKYVIVFSKTGYAKYTSHLDINRLFRRSIRKQGIKLAYSQGFNPHPKMGFAQPLSLGYAAERELLEIETTESYQTWFLKDKLQEVMPEGIHVIDVKTLDESIKSLAAMVDYAVYEVSIPIEGSIGDINGLASGYLGQDKIMALKQNKKKKETTSVDIKNKIRKLELEMVNNNIFMKMTLDSGSLSNLSPELVISTFLSYSRLNIERSRIDVTRKEIGFNRPLDL